MPEGREGKLAEPFSFALLPMNFYGAGGGRGSGFWWISTLGGGAFGICRPACREGEHFDHFVFACAFQFSLTGGRCFREISTFGGATFGGFILLGREGKRAAQFSFALPPLKFHGSGGRGGADSGGSTLSAAVLLIYASQRVGRKSVLNFCFLLCLRRSNFPDLGAVFTGDLYNRRRRFW